MLVKHGHAVEEIATMRLFGFLRDCKGGVAPLLALGAVPLMFGVGAAVDYSRANAARTAMQAAVDATAIMLLKQVQQLSSDQVSENATAYFNANFTRPDVQNVQVTAAASSQSGGSSLNVSASGSVRTLIVGLMGISAINVAVNAGAFSSTDGLGCVLSLNKTASAATGAQGSTAVNLNNCSLYDNSSSSTALSVGGSATLSALSIGVVGGISGSAGLTTTQGVKTGQAPVSDPYVNDGYPNFTGCSQNNFTAKNTVTIDPGVYCGGISLNANANVTLNSGIYYIDGGGLSVNGGATLTGAGVTLVFTKKSGARWPTVTINGNATVNLTPPRSGATAGIVVFGDRNIPLGTTFKFNGGANQYLGGAIYVPTGTISFSGGAGTSTSCTQIIGDIVTFVGNSSLAINCSSYGTKPFSPSILKLTS
jgi:Flp pilus assembly protein TadG